MTANPLSRRSALKLLTATAATTLSPLSPAGPPAPQHADVLIVGAGFAGLLAAKTLLRSNKKVLLLEARSRVGGRVMSGKLAGHDVDLGGMWVGPTQDRVLALIKDYGLHLTPQFEEGKGIAELNGKRAIADGEDLGLDPDTQAEYDRVIAELDRLASEVPLDAPWTAPRANEWDQLTLQDWINSATKNQAVRGFLESQARINLADDAFQISLLYFLFYTHSAGNLEIMNGYRNGAQAFLVKETMHHLAVQIAKDFSDSILLDAPVRSISQNDSGVTVVSDKGTFTAGHAIVAVPLPLSVRISYNPPLPPQRDALAQRMPMGSVIKYWVAYEKPFWRTRGFNGLTWSDSSPSVALADASPSAGGPGFLVGFLEAHNALKWAGKPREERKKVVLEKIVSYFGPEAANPIDYLDQDWPAEEWSRGCYEAFMGPGVMTTVGHSMRQPHGRIHWAGTETSSRWIGYIDGAVRSGERAAQEILAQQK